jgi:hypothetical protein
MDISHNRVGGLVQLLQYGEVKLSGRLNVREVDRLMKVISFIQPWATLVSLKTYINLHDFSDRSEPWMFTRNGCSYCH